MPRDLNDAQCREIAEMAEANHIWINALSTIRPTPEILQSIGQQVLDMLNQKDNLLPAGARHDCDLAKLTPCLYLYVNKS
jgi:hypothetical protein